MNQKELEALYIEAKEAYYDGTPIMSDADFDDLESQLKQLDSAIIEAVGADGSYTVKHPSEMLSLSKVMVLDRNEMPTQEFNKWASQDQQFEFTPKLDGSSCNLIYRNGTLVQAATRGNGKMGTDILKKMEHIVPKDIELFGEVEIRGEVVIPVNTFNQFFAKDYKNPRNFVAGILNRKDEFEAVKHFKFIAFEMRHHLKNDIEHYSITELKKQGFDIPFFTVAHKNDFEIVYDKMESHRLNDSQFQLDGFVAKYSLAHRRTMGETSHHPNWAIAIKFPPREAVTEIVDIEWNTGSTQELCPVAILKPVDLDGTTVKRVSVYNYDNVKTNALTPGAIIAIAKAGDIIPIIKRIIKKSDSPIQIPSRCSCGAPTTIDGGHLMCTSDFCSAANVVKFDRAIQLLGMKRVGASLNDRLRSAGIQRIEDLFDKTKFNSTKLIQSGQFTDGRTLEIIFDAFENRKKLSTAMLIELLQVDGCGSRMSKELAKGVRGIPANYAGLTAKIYQQFLSDTPVRRRLDSFIALVKANGYQLHDEEVSSSALKIELSGSPKPIWKTKEELLQDLSGKVTHYGLKADTDYLVTDDINSSSSKMSKAQKLGVKIISYSELQNLLA